MCGFGVDSSVDSSQKLNAAFSAAVLIESSAATIMDSEFLTRLAHQLRAGKTPVCRRAINRILEEMKKRWDNEEYDSPMAAESAFRRFAENELSCQKSRST
jgi:hypothetical protein